MRQDRNDDPVVLGYDLRITLAQDVQPSLDPMIWPSLRQMDGQLFCSIFSQNRIWDISNGLNLAILPPEKEIPKEYVLAAFDASVDIVEYMSESFGLQHSLVAFSDVVLSEDYCFIGYDVVDLWTQSSFLFFCDHYDEFIKNNWNLLPSKMIAERVCKIADRVFPGDYPHQPIGIWIKPA